eukprot:UN19031
MGVYHLGRSLNPEEVYYSLIRLSYPFVNPTRSTKRYSNLHRLRAKYRPAIWFLINSICGKPRPYKKFWVLYEWVEDEIEEDGSILCSEVREQSGIPLEKILDLTRRLKTC